MLFVLQKNIQPEAFLCMYAGHNHVVLCVVELEENYFHFWFMN